MELKTKDTYKASQFHKKSRIFMDTIVENFGFFVEGCHVPPVKYVIWLLGMEPTHLTDRVIWTCPIYNLPFNRKSFLLLLKLPNIHTKCCSCLVFWIYHICSMLVVSVSKILCATNICFNFITRNWLVLFRIQKKI